MHCKGVTFPYGASFDFSATSEVDMAALPELADQEGQSVSTWDRGILYQVERRKPELRYSVGKMVNLVGKKWDGFWGYRTSERNGSLTDDVSMTRSAGLEKTAILTHLAEWKVP